MRVAHTLKLGRCAEPAQLGEGKTVQYRMLSHTLKLGMLRESRTLGLGMLRERHRKPRINQRHWIYGGGGNR